VLAVAVAGTGVDRARPFWLSFTSLSELARRCGIAPDRAWVWPLIVDGVSRRGHGLGRGDERRRMDRRAVRYAWTLLLAGACISVLANASHAVGCRRRARAVGAGGAWCGGPPVVLVRDHPSGRSS